MPDQDHLESSRRRRIFFLHIMKTGGRTFTTQMWRQFGPAGIYGGYGSAEADPITSIYRYLNPRPLAQLDAETVARYEVFGGHFPYVARSLMGDDVVTMTVFRDPVERVISFLKHAKRDHVEHHDLALEEIYEDQWYFNRFCDNHQVKMFSMTADEMLRHSTADGWEEQGWSEEQRALLRRWREEPTSLTDQERLEFHDMAAAVASDARGASRLLGAPNTAEVEVDDARLRQAIENLRSVDIVGLFEDYGSFMNVVSSRLGLRLNSRIRVNRSESQPVSKALRARIAAQNGPAIELYEVARKIAREEHHTARRAVR